MIHSVSKLKNEKGFTLIELLIVIVVLGILAAIVLFAVGTAKGDSKAAACKADKATVETALEAYKANNSGYPTSPDQSGLIPNYLKSSAAHVTGWNSSGVVTGTTDCT